MRQDLPQGTRTKPPPCTNWHHATAAGTARGLLIAPTSRAEGQQRCRQGASGKQHVCWGSTCAETRRVCPFHTHTCAPVSQPCGQLLPFRSQTSPPLSLAHAGRPCIQPVFSCPVGVDTSPLPGQGLSHPCWKRGQACHMPGVRQLHC